MKITRNIKISFNRILMPFPILFIFALLLLSPEVSLDYMKYSLELCAKSLVPSLFPFMVISDFLIASNFGGIIKSLISKITGFVFGTSHDGSFAVVLGLLCGFPVGAKSALRLYKQNKISHAELCHIMSFCNIPSPAFMCGTVAMMFQSRELGTLLFFSLVLSSVIIGVIGRTIYKYERKSTSSFAEHTDVAAAFTTSVTSSALVMICVCAYVVFFSVLIGYSRHLCELFGARDTLPLILSGLLEISNGMSCAAGADTEIAPLIAAFFAGFSGLSVIFQIFSLDTSRSIRKKAFVLQKLLQGGLCSLIMFFALKICPVSLNPLTETMNKISFESYGLYIGILFFISASLPILATLGQKKR